MVSLLVWTGALGPQSGADPDRLVEWAEKAVGGMPENGDPVAILGIAFYRAGRYDRAVQQWDQALALRNAGKVGVALEGSGVREGRVLRAVGKAEVDTLFLAMTHHRRGQKRKARNQLTSVERRMVAQLQPDGEGREGLPWEIQAAYEILYREAKATLQGK